MIEAAQEADGIVASGLPEVAIQATEEIDGGVVPAPAKVIGDRKERLQRIRQRGSNFECSDRFHGDLGTEGGETERHRKRERKLTRRFHRSGRFDRSLDLRREGRRQRRQPLEAEDGTGGSSCQRN